MASLPARARIAGQAKPIQPRVSAVDEEEDMFSTSTSLRPASADVDGHALFGQTMGLVAITAGLFAFGAYLGQNLSSGWSWVWYGVSLVCLIAMNAAVQRSSQAAVTLLFGFGLTLGLATASTLAYYAGVDPSVLWRAAGATALFMCGFGVAGYATRRDLSPLARLLFWALFALIGFGVVTIFVNIPSADLAYSILGLAIFAGLTTVDFQRLRGASDLDSAPLLASSIFLDGLNVFMFFIDLFRGGKD
jgi:modulator of FtsH protease